MNIRNDIYEKVKFMLKGDPEIKINYAKLGRQFNLLFIIAAVGNKFRKDMI